MVSAHGSSQMANRAGIADAGFFEADISTRAIGFFISPREPSCVVAPTGRLFPLRLCWQSLAGPGAVVSSPIPIYLDDRIVRIGRVVVIGRARL